MNGLALCAGIGGLELGLRRVWTDLRTVCWCEWDRYAASVLVSRMQEGALDPAPVWDDLATFDGRPWRGVVDLVSAGYPCQPFSVAGRRRGTDDPRHLWPHVARIIREVGPSLVVVENVAGHVRLGLPEVLGELAEMGFDAEWGCFRASEVGAPHQRERVFVLAYRCGTRLPGWPSECRDDGEELAPAERGGDPLAYCPERGLGELRGAPGRDGLADCGEPAVAEATRLGHERCGESRRRRSGPADGGGLVGDADSFAELQPEDEGRSERSSGEAWAGSGRPGVFPPGPGDADAWAAVLAAAPELAPAVEPAVCGVADGVPARLVSAVRRHRLRCLGNAVVPAQAEYAVRCLLGRLS